MAYKALYRSYRPAKFSECFGQTHIIKTLKNALLEQRASHAYIFSGQRGIGKTTIARILAKAVNCENLQDGEPCNECRSCRAIQNNETTDIVELDAASNNSVDEMRSLLDKVNFLPSFLKKKVYIIDEAHMLSTSAFNALLKTLEEPPSYVMFIFATTEPNKIPLTILSRCQRFDFQPLTEEEIQQELVVVSNKENIKIDESALIGIAKASEGGMRDALSILDEASIYSSKEVSLEDVEAVTGRVSSKKMMLLISNICDNKTMEVLQTVSELLNQGKEVSSLLVGLICLCRDLLIFKNIPTKTFSLYNMEDLKNLSEKISGPQLFYYIDSFVDIQNKLRFTNSQKICLEVGLLKIINSMSDELNLSKRIQQVEDKINSLSLPGVQLEDKLQSMENSLQKFIRQMEALNLQKFKDETKNNYQMLESEVSKSISFPNDFQIKLDNIEDKINILKSQIELEKNQQITPSVMNNDQTGSANIDANAIQSQIDTILAQLDLQSSTEKKDIELVGIKTLEANQDINGKIDKISNDLKELIAKETASIAELPNETQTTELVDSPHSNMSDIQNQQLLDTKNSIEELKKDILSLQNKIKLEDNDDLVSVTNLKIDISNIQKEIDLIKQNQLRERAIVEPVKIVDSRETPSDFTQPDSALLKPAQQESFEEEQLQNTDQQEEPDNDSVTDNSTELYIKEEKKEELTEENSSPSSINENESQEIEKETPEPGPSLFDFKPTVEDKINKAIVLGQPVEQSSDVYDIKVVERTLHEAREQECRNQKEVLQQNWPKIEEKSGALLAPVAKLLVQGKMVANGVESLIIIYPSAATCNYLMESKNHYDARQLLLVTFQKNYDFICLPVNTWQEKRGEYHTQYSIGTKYPKLTPFNNPELKVIQVDKDAFYEKANVLKKAEAIFGEDLISKEK